MKPPSFLLNFLSFPPIPGDIRPTKPIKTPTLLAFPCHGIIIVVNISIRHYTGLFHSLRCLALHLHLHPDLHNLPDSSLPTVFEYLECIPYILYISFFLLLSLYSREKDKFSLPSPPHPASSP